MDHQTQNLYSLTPGDIATDKKKVASLNLSHLKAIYCTEYEVTYCQKYVRYFITSPKVYLHDFIFDCIPSLVL